MFTRNGYPTETPSSAALAIHSAGIPISWCLNLLSALVLSGALGCGSGDATSANNEGQSEAGNASDNKAIRLKDQITRTTRWRMAGRSLPGRRCVG